MNQFTTYVWLTCAALVAAFGMHLADAPARASSKAMPYRPSVHQHTHQIALPADEMVMVEDVERVLENGQPVLYATRHGGTSHGRHDERTRRRERSS